MEKPELVMLIGLPACGKSSFAGDLEKKGYVVHSSDKIRLELNEENMNTKEHNKKVFEILHKRIKKDLKEGKNCVYDATNLSRKFRKAFLDELKNIPCEKNAVLFIVPTYVCADRNSKREGFSRVPNDVYLKMLKSFNLPSKNYDGFDKITLDIYNLPIAMYDYENLDHFSQDNSHHVESLGEHMKMAEEYAKELIKGQDIDERLAKNIISAARWHDIGKVHTKDFHNSKGEITKEAHYYGHENVSAYLYLCKALSDMDLWKYSDNKYPKEIEERIDDMLITAEIINWHMTPHTVWKDSERRRVTDRELLNKDVLRGIDILYEADKMASISKEKEDIEEDIDL